MTQAITCGALAAVFDLIFVWLYAIWAVAAFVLSVDFIITGAIAGRWRAIPLASIAVLVFTFLLLALLLAVRFVVVSWCLSW